MLQFLLIGRFFIPPHYVILCFQTIPSFKHTILKELLSTVFGLHLAKLRSSLITAVRTSHSAEEQCIFVVNIIIIITIISQSSSSALQSLVGFGVFHTSLPVCSVLYSPLHPLTPHHHKVHHHVVQPPGTWSSLLQKTLPFSTLLGVHSSDTPHGLAILSSVHSRTLQRHILQFQFHVIP